MSCRPMGRPVEEKPHGTDIPGIPARLADKVKMSDKYMVSGSSTFSPILNAGVGAIGDTMTSQLSNAFLKSSRISERTWEALR